MPDSKLTTVVAWIFGLMMVALSAFVTLEVISRKFFSHSFQGADELGGYALAVGGALAFTVALVERGHIRIDLIHERLGPRAQAFLNWLSAVLLGALGLFLARYCWLALRDSIAYGSTAPTAWATPMVWPQSLWYAAILIFTAASVWQAVRATRMFLAGRTQALNAEFHVKGAMEELEDELSDLARR